MKDKKQEKSLEKQTSSSALTKILEIPLSATAKIEVAIDRANAEARIKIIQADLIIKYGLLRGDNTKKGDA